MATFAPTDLQLSGTKIDEDGLIVGTIN